jgi:predicted ATP-grasp superfamily ATP-dependent carboligase
MSGLMRSLSGLHLKPSLWTASLWTVTGAWHNRRPRVLVTDGETRGVLSAVRGLDAAGFEVIVAACAPFALAPAFWSRAASQRITTPHPLIDEAGFLHVVERAVLQTRPEVLLAGSDASLLAVSRARERLEPHVRLGLPPHSTLERCLSKVALAAAATRHGLSAPESVICQSVEEAAEAARAFGYPLLMKPVCSIIEDGCARSRSGSRVVCSREELIATRPRLGDEVLVQRRLAGSIVSFAGVFADGEVVAEAVSRYERTWQPLAGNACRSETIDAPETLRGRVLGLLTELGWEGMFELELIEDGCGEWHAIDMNPRPYGSLALAISAGANLPAVWCWHLLGERQRPVRARAGVRYRWTDADLRHRIWQLRGGARDVDCGAREAAGGARVVAGGARVVAGGAPRPPRGVVHPYLSLADPGPGAARLLELGARALGRREPEGTLIARAPAVVIGAGPSGLAAVAYLRKAGIDTLCFGAALESWERHMPAGMLLRSRWRSSHIAAPGRTLTLDEYVRSQKRRIGEPRLRREEFIDYGRWYARRAVPRLDGRKVAKLALRHGDFRLRLSDGEELQASRVVVAAGLAPFRHVPAQFVQLPPDRCSHVYDHADLSGFSGRRVAVVGAGQSALECAALLHECGAEVLVLCRAQEIRWLAPEVDETPAAAALPLRQAPPTDVGGRLNGWIAAVPDVFRALPARLQPTISQRCIRPAGAAWLRPRLASVPFTFGVQVRRARVRDGEVLLECSDQTTHRCDHVLLGTGYVVDVRRYAFMGEDLIRSLRLAGGYPVLGPGLESSIPGLHFMGAPAAHSFGPIMRFVVGTWYSAPAVARRAAGARQPPLAVAFPRGIARA